MNFASSGPLTQGCEAVPLASPASDRMRASNLCSVSDLASFEYRLNLLWRNYLNWEVYAQDDNYLWNI